MTAYVVHQRRLAGTGFSINPVDAMTFSKPPCKVVPETATVRFGRLICLRTVKDPLVTSLDPVKVVVDLLLTGENVRMEQAPRNLVIDVKRL